MNASGVSPHKLGLVWAAFVACWHLVWSLLVFLGWAQPLTNFVFWLHFITPPFQIGAFVFWRALVLIAVTAAVGYIVGRVVGAIWNWVHDS